MGQKVNPNGLRLGINKDWQAKWYAKGKDFSKNLEKDVKIREYLTENLKNAGIAKVEIERNSKRCEVVIHTSKPGVMIGHGGEEIEKLKKQLSNMVDENVQISISDVKNADLILTMTSGHKMTLKSVFPGYKDKIYTLNEKAYSKDSDIADPFGGEQEVYNECCEEITGAVEKLLCTL